MESSNEPQESKQPEAEAAREGKDVDFSIKESEIDQGGDDSMKHSKRSKRKHRLHLPHTKKGYAILALVIVVIAGALFLLLGSNGKKVATLAATPKHVAKSDLIASTLSGLPVAPSVNKIPVTGVMIENSTFARPQSGLSQAEVVFEALAEGGITRFLALYQDTAPTSIGPIRSVRPYYISWAMGFDASIAHVGGSPDGLADLKAWGAKDLDEFYNGSSYHRITTRQAPHNVYTSISDLNQLESTKGFTSVNFKGFPRKAAAPDKIPGVTNINLDIGTSAYNVVYTYDGSTNSYNRSEGGAVMTDANTNTQISPKVVIAIVVQESQGALDASDAYYSNYTTVGSGAAYVFQDGGLTVGQWSKSSNSAQITFTDSNGKVIKLDPGQTWITALTSANQVTYSK